MEHLEVTVNGMTCGHCVAAVVGAVSVLPGVRTAEVDLASHLLRIGFDEPIDLANLREAVMEAGYELVASDEKED